MLSCEKQCKVCLGEDIKMNQGVELANQGLTGCFLGREIFEKNLSEWLEMVWRPLLGYTVGFYLLVRGWLASFLKVKRMLQRFWV